MGGDDLACRVLFDFDTVEYIRRFDPIDQSSVGGGHDKAAALTIRPLKELVWSDDRIEALSRNLASMEEFATAGGGQGRAVLEVLMSRGTVPGEELFFPLAFEGAGFPGVLPDYLGEDGTVCFFEKERLENAQESLDR